MCVHLCRLVSPPMATDGGLKLFHSSDYIDYMKSTQVLTENDADDDEKDSLAEKYGLSTLTDN